MAKNSHTIGHVVFIALYGTLIVSSILFYNSVGITPLLYAGGATLILGAITVFWASQSRGKGSLVESGLYAFIRHPEFLGHMLIIFSLILLSQHPISLIIGVMLITLLYLAMLDEERRNVEKFGDAYIDYMKRVPRVNLLAGFIKRIYRRKV